MDTMNRKFANIEWNGYKDSIFSSLSILRTSEIYTDVLISCEASFYPAHRLILSLSSQYFAQAFQQLPTTGYPIFILCGISKQIFEALLTYVYEGKVTIGAEDVASFIKAGSILKISGLAEKKTMISPINDPELNLYENSYSALIKPEIDIDEFIDVEWGHEIPCAEPNSPSPCKQNSHNSDYLNIESNDKLANRISTVNIGERDKDELMELEDLDLTQSTNYNMDTTDLEISTPSEMYLANRTSSPIYKDVIKSCENNITDIINFKIHTPAKIDLNSRASSSIGTDVTQNCENHITDTINFKIHTPTKIDVDSHASSSIGTDVTEKFENNITNIINLEIHTPNKIDLNSYASSSIGKEDSSEHLLSDGDSTFSNVEDPPVQLEPAVISPSKNIARKRPTNKIMCDCCNIPFRSLFNLWRHTNKMKSFVRNRSLRSRVKEIDSIDNNKGNKRKLKYKNSPKKDSKSNRSVIIDQPNHDISSEIFFSPERPRKKFKRNTNRRIANHVIRKNPPRKINSKPSEASLNASGDQFSPEILNVVSLNEGSNENGDISGNLNENNISDTENCYKISKDMGKENSSQRDYSHLDSNADILNEYNGQVIAELGPDFCDKDFNSISSTEELNSDLPNNISGVDILRGVVNNSHIITKIEEDSVNEILCQDTLNCCICTKDFSKQNDFRDHRQTTCKILQCPYCFEAYLYSEKSFFNIHISIHLDQKNPYLCPECLYQAADVIGMNKHFTEKNCVYDACPICEYRGRTANDLRMHVIDEHSSVKIM